MPGLLKFSALSLFSFFYLIAGVALTAMVVQSGAFPVHVGLLGVLSLIASYGLNRMKRWALFLTVLSALPGISFGCVTIYAIYKVLRSGFTEILFLSAMFLYVAFSVASLFYIVAKRGSLK